MVSAGNGWKKETKNVFKFLWKFIYLDMIFDPNVVRSDDKIPIQIFSATNLHRIFIVISCVSYQYVIGTFLIPSPGSHEVDIHVNCMWHPYVPETFNVVW